MGDKRGSIGLLLSGHLAPLIVFICDFISVSLCVDQSSFMHVDISKERISLNHKKETKIGSWLTPGQASPAKSERRCQGGCRVDGLQARDGRRGCCALARRIARGIAPV